MSRKVGTWSAFVVVAAVAALGCEGPKGADGAAGPEGPKGDAGAACAVTDNGNGTKTIACTDGTSATVTDGARGEAGTSCTVTDNGDGTRTLACTDNTSITLTDGEDGTDGTDGDDCTVTDNGDGTKTVACGATTATIANGAKGDTGDAGAAGTSCSVTDNGNGTKTIGCTDDTSVLVSDGAQGLQGDKGDKGDKGDTGATGPSAAFVFNVNAEVPAALFLSVTEAPTVAGKPVVKFTVKDAIGRGAVGLKGGSSGWVRTNLSKLVPAADGEPSDWDNYVRSSSSGNPTYERGALVDNGDGSYVYTFVTDVTAVATVAWEPALTHRMAFQLSGTTPAGALPYLNATFDWVPDGVAAVSTRAVTSTAICNECHGQLRIHGSRIEVGYCVTCHNSDLGDGDMALMAHAIHGAEFRHEVGAPGFELGGHEYGEVTYPIIGGLNKCLKCHDGAKTADGDNWKNFPTMQACGACHADVDFASHMGGQTDNTGCGNSSCHTAARIVTVHAGENNSPNATAVIAGASNFVYEIMSVTMADDTHPAITFKITRDGVAMDLTALPADLTGGPSFLLAYAAPVDPATPADEFAPVDYNNLGKAAAQPASVSLANLRAGTAGTLAADAVNTGYYVATLSGTNAFPADAKLRAIALQGYFSQTGIPGHATAVGRHTLSVVKEVAGDTVRREVVDSQKCGACHEWFEGHGGNRNVGLGTLGQSVCTTCHVPNLTTSGRGADPATVLARLRNNTDLNWDLNADGACDADEDANTDTFCDVLDALLLAGYTPTDPLTFPEVSNNLKDMIHAVHASAIRTGAYQEVRDRGTSGVFYYDFSHITYPDNKKACLACHKPGTFDGVPMGADLSTWVTSNGTNDRTNVLAARGTLPNAQDIVRTPFAAACYTCHDTSLAKAHMEQNGAFIDVARDAVPAMFYETCAVCHGAGRAADVNVVHFQ